MTLRIYKTLSRWAVMPETTPPGADKQQKSLTAELTTLLGRAPNREEIAAARRLFAQIVDTPGGMKIMTIHAFCTSVLNRFPLEAGISPHAKPLEDYEAKAILTQARDDILRKATASPAGSPLHAALNPGLRQRALPTARHPQNPFRPGWNLHAKL
jgi:ATP-dependent helicase/nuclease subunit A